MSASPRQLASGCFHLRAGDARAPKMQRKLLVKSGTAPLTSSKSLQTQDAAPGMPATPVGDFHGSIVVIDDTQSVITLDDSDGFYHRLPIAPPVAPARHALAE